METHLMLEENKSLVRRFVDEMLNRRNPAVIDELVAPDFVDHDAPAGQAPGPEGVKKALEEVERSLADLHVRTEHMVAEQDLVVTTDTAEATHVGPFLGFAATGRRLRWTAISMYRIAGGRIAERWGLLDYRALHRQLSA